jgi:fructokinase
MYTRSGEKIESKGYKVNAIDTTGAGDAFIGSFIYKLLANEKKVDTLLSNIAEYQQIMDFSNRIASIVVTKYGAIPAMPTLNEVQEQQNEK